MAKQTDTLKPKAMSTQEKTFITVQNTINAPVQKVWELWSKPEHITKWNNASDDWHSPRGENDLREGGKFNIRMEAKDGSMGFDFGGIYDIVKQHEYIEYTMGDNRKVKVSFTSEDNKTILVESFEPETLHPHEMQQAGWQAILDSFKRYAEK